MRYEVEITCGRCQHVHVLTLNEGERLPKKCESCGHKIIEIPQEVATS